MSGPSWRSVAAVVVGFMVAQMVLAVIEGEALAAATSGVMVGVWAAVLVHEVGRTTS